MITLKRILTIVMIMGGAFLLASHAHAGTGYKALASGYYPSHHGVEGGFKDRKDHRLHTLQDYLRGQAPYVSVAMDPKAFAYGTKLRIPELEAYYHRQIDFRVVDKGDAFIGQGKKRIDICVDDRTESLKREVNTHLTLVPVR